MNTRILLAAAALLLGGLATPALAAGPASVGTVTPQQFAMQAAEGGLAEVQLSELAHKQAGSAEVREFAERMIADHGKANTELQAIARQKGMKLPKEINAEHRATMKTLQGKKGAEFDAAYMAAMKKDHVKTIALFQAANGPTFDDPDLKAFASKTLPTLEAHHSMVEKTEAATGAATSSR